MKKDISKYEFMSDDLVGISAILENFGVSLVNFDDYLLNEQKALNLMSHKLQEIAKKYDELIEIAYELSGENSELREKIARYEINEELLKAFQAGLKPQS